MTHDRTFTEICQAILNCVLNYLRTSTLELFQKITMFWIVIFSPDNDSNWWKPFGGQILDCTDFYKMTHKYVISWKKNINLFHQYKLEIFNYFGYVHEKSEIHQ